LILKTDLVKRLKTIRIQKMVEQRFSSEVIEEIKNIKLEKEMVDSIGEVIVFDCPHLVRIFPFNTKSIEAVEEFLGNTIRLAKYNGVRLGKCEDFIDQAVDENLSPVFDDQVKRNFSFINRRLTEWGTSFSDVLKESVAVLKDVLESRFPEEFVKGDNKGGVIINSEQSKEEWLEEAIWNQGLNEKEVKLLVDFWNQVGEEDRKVLLSQHNGSSWVDASMAIARFLGQPPNKNTEKLGEILSNALLKFC
jgi:hypothetical protein